MLNEKDMNGIILAFIGAKGEKVLDEIGWDEFVNYARHVMNLHEWMISKINSGTVNIDTLMQKIVESDNEAKKFLDGVTIGESGLSFSQLYPEIDGKHPYKIIYDNAKLKMIIAMLMKINAELFKRLGDSDYKSVEIETA